MQVSESITRKSASNLALAFILLPKPKRLGMSALYALCREVDDLADNDSRPIQDRRADLDRWRADLRTAVAGGEPSLPVVRELKPVIHHYRLPFDLFDDLLRGVEGDLDTVRYATYEALDLYCYRVASVVGLLSIEIFGYRDPGCRRYAIALGKALQLTNILRDVRNDAERGRIYLPLAELDRFGVTEREILNFEASDRFHALARGVAGRARLFYAEAREALPSVDRSAMAAAELMGSVYWRLLKKLEENRFSLFDRRLTRISRPQKIFLMARTWYRTWKGATAPNYGVVGEG